MSSALLYLRVLAVSLGLLFLASSISSSDGYADGAANRTIEAVDWSKFQDAHTAPDMRRLKDGGVEMVIIGGWHGDDLGLNTNCNHDLTLARAAGLKTAVYTVVDGPDGTNPEDAVLKALWACGREAAHASFIAIDAEVESATPDRLRQAAFAVRLLGKTPIIYTARWFWNGRIGNPQEGCDLPLWNALYDFTPDFNFHEQPYGCWTPDQVVGEQYSNESRFDGLVLDHSAFRTDFIDSLATATPSPTLTATPSPSPTPQQTPTAFVPATPSVRSPFLQNTLDTCDAGWFGTLLERWRGCTEPGHP